MKTPFIVGVFLIAVLVIGAVVSMAFVASLPEVTSSSTSRSGAEGFFPFFFFPSMFSGSYTSNAVPVSISAPMKLNQSTISLIVVASVGTVSIDFSNENEYQYQIQGMISKNSPLPTANLTGSALEMSLPIGTFTITLPSSPEYTIQISMSTGSLKFEGGTGSGVPSISQFNAQLNTGTLSFNINSQLIKQATLEVSTGTLTGGISTQGGAVQVTASSGYGRASIHGNNLITVNQAQGFEQVKTSNFDSSSQKSDIDLHVSVGTVSAEVD